MENVRPHIQLLIARGKITSAELKNVRANSWEWEAMIPAMDDDAFLEMLQSNLLNCRRLPRRPFATYEEALQGLYVPELIKRFDTLRQRRKR